MYNNYMIDLETTGTNGGRHAMIQIAGFRFGLNKGEIDPKPFNRCLHVDPWRSWDEGTRHWWTSNAERREILKSIVQRQEPAAVVLKDFQTWVLESDNPKLFAKPSHFEFPFIESAFKDHQLVNPFHYRATEDMNSYIRGSHFPDEPPEIQMPFHGPAHDAVWDAMNQIEVLWEHLELAKASKEEAWQYRDLNK